MTESDRPYWVALTAFRPFGPVRMARIARRFPSMERAFAASAIELVEAGIGEGLLGPDEKFLVDAALTLAHPVNLAYGYPHGFGQVGQVLVASDGHFKDSCPDNHTTLVLLRKCQLAIL